MGKDKTDTILLESPNIKNDKNKFIENKENSIKSNKSKGPPKFSLKVRSDLTAEVLEDEHTNDSICSTNSKSNIASSSSSSDTTQNSSSTSNKDKHNHSNVKSPEKEKAISEKAEEENTTQFRIASNNPTGFKLRIVPLEKLLEKPPPPPKPSSPPAKVVKKENIPVERSRRLPQRRSKPVSFIELSDTEEEEEEEDTESESTVSDKQVNNRRGVSANISKKETTKKSQSKEDNSTRTLSKKKPAKISSDSEEDGSKKSNTTKKSTKKASDSEADKSIKSKSKKKLAKDTSSDSEEDEPKKTKPKTKLLKEPSDSEEEESKTFKNKNKKSAKDKSSGSEEDTKKNTRSKNKNGKEELKKSKTNKQIAKDTSSESEKDQPEELLENSEEEEEEPTNTKSKKKLAGDEETETKKSKTNKKSAEETFDTENKETKKSTNKTKSDKATSETGEEDFKLALSTDSEEKESYKSKSKNKSTKQLSDAKEHEHNNSKLKEISTTEKTEKSKSDKEVSERRESTDSEKNKSIKSSSKRKRLELSDSDEETSVRTKAKRNITVFESVKQKSGPKSKKPQGPPPSPSTVRRCVVRIKRSKLSDFKDIGKNKSKRKMNGGGKSEKPSTSRRKLASSDDDSDFDFRRAAIAEHDYDCRDVADDDDDDDDKASQKSSDSEIIPTRKKRVFRKNQDNSNNSDSDFEPKQKEKKKKRRIQRNSTDDSDDDEKKKVNRKDIRKIIKSDDLNLSTKEAAKQEQDRRKRIEERQKLYNQIYEKPDSIEVNELVLDFDTEDATTLLEVDKGLMKKLKPHQVTGVKFMWDACFETIADAQEKSGSGCILAHCMGLGKTMQIVTLSHTLLANSRKTNVDRVLIISPLSTLNNWAREFKHWISFTKKRNIEVYDMSKYKDKATRIFKLNEWYEEGGVCIMGYDMYRILSNEKAKGLKKKQREYLLQSLVDPGPDLVVCDEGHLLKNEKTSISKAVTRMRTQRRIVLTGTPLQNNLKEYYCMIQFIKPNLLGTYKEYLNRFVNPISNGQYTDSTDRDIRLMKHRSHILHKLLEGCIQRRDYSVLAPYLPPKHEYVVYTTLSMLQQLLYEHYMVHQRDLSVNSSEGKGAKLFQDFQELRRIWTHPMNMRINSDSVIRKKILANESDSMDDFIDDDKDDDDGADSSSDSSVGSSKSFGSQGDGASSSKVVKTRNFRHKAKEDGIEIESDIEEVVQPQQDDPSEWWKRFVADKELNNINHSPKLVILMRLLEQCEAIGDKLLVFSQSLQSLDTIEHFLSLVDSKTRGYEYEGDVGDLKGFWKPGTDYFRLDGSCSVEQRESMCKKFNDSTNLRARLFLISTRAGGLGINLVSANRVVIFDVSWNPSHDTQSIFRVYRFGQVKPCYIYRLIAMGTMEQKLYERQVAKQATAKRVIDEQQISRHYNQSDLQELYTYELQPTVSREIPILPKDRLFAELLTEHESLLFKYHEHDSLLENEESENLSADERKAAWSEYEAEKTRAVQTAQYVAYDRSAYGQFGNSSGSVTSNKIFGFRSDVLLQLLNMKIAKDHPEMNQNQVIQVVPTYLNELYSQMNVGDPTMYKDLLNLHGTLTHPSGMYMNPLLYVNQNPSAAGYFQAGGQPANGVGAVPMVGGPVMVPGGVPMMGMPIVGPTPTPAAAPGFDPNEVYEID